MPILPPVGVPLGAWYPQTTAPPRGPIIVAADKIDPSTGELLSLFSGRDPVDAIVIHQHMVVEGSGSAVLDTGHRFFDVKKNTQHAASDLANEEKRLVQPLVDARLIRVDRIDTSAVGTRGTVSLEYTNTLTRKPQTAGVTKPEA